MRVHELTKQISLAKLDAPAPQTLKLKGECSLTLSEELFDLDYPGHYLRRIKSVKLTFSCVPGSFCMINCSLTLNKHSIRVSGASCGAADYPRRTVAGLAVEDQRFREVVGAIQSIVTGNAQEDTGLFELNMRDERDLPFAGAGAISHWHLQFSITSASQFDFHSISDVILHLQFTAEDGGDALRSDALASLECRIKPCRSLPLESSVHKPPQVRTALADPSVQNGTR